MLLCGWSVCVRYILYAVDSVGACWTIQSSTVLGVSMFCTLITPTVIPLADFLPEWVNHFLLCTCIRLHVYKAKCHCTWYGLKMELDFCAMENRDPTMYNYMLYLMPVTDEPLTPLMALYHLLPPQIIEILCMCYYSIKIIVKPRSLVFAWVSSLFYEVPLTFIL